ncbi:superoxide dismutase [Mn] [Lachnospiraceae bacterium KM106-2]|nr:superoxide dismutase [Mn] [Lachnospiraceae bacterium KM106-2]
MLINPIEFTFTPDITAVNKQQFDEHLKLYNNYVKSINEITNELVTLNNEEREKANTTNGYFRGLKRGETYALDGVILHELYFYNMGGIKSKPDCSILSLIEHFYGGFENWRADFIATAKASRGWAILCYEQRTKMLRNISLDAHDHGDIMMSLPLLILDMYEHAYFMQYGTNKESYIKAFLNNINWDIVRNRVNLWHLDEETK